MSYLKKVTTDAHNVLNNTLGQKHLSSTTMNTYSIKDWILIANFQDVQCLKF